MPPRLLQQLAVARQSMARWPQQVVEGWRRVPSLTRLVAIDHVVVCGMGGSALGADMVRSGAAAQLRKPLSVVNSYDIPAWANSRTLVVCASYSGNTQETLSCFAQARRRKLPVVAVTTGGALVKLARAKKVPMAIIIDDTLNPSRQPRLGLGFQIGALLRILQHTRALNISNAQVAALGAGLATPAAIPAATIKALSGRILLVLGVDSLAGAAHAVANQLNENAKVLAAPFSLPEADHHLLEALGTFTAVSKQLGAVVLRPGRVAPRLARQVQATIEIIKRQHVTVVQWRGRGNNSLGQSLQAAAWGARLSLALAERAHLDPLAIPWVTNLKQRLG